MLALGISTTAGVISGCGGGGSSGGGDTTSPPPPPPPPSPPPSGDIEPVFSSIQANVFTPICTQCHAGGSAPEGLVLEESQSYGMLVDRRAAQVMNLDRVEPGDPDNSYLVHKIEGTQAFGDRMPQGLPPLDNDEIQAIRQWISDGAVDDRATRRSEGMISMSSAWPATDGGTVAGKHPLTLNAGTALDPSRIHEGAVSVYDIATLDPATLQPLSVPVTLRHTTPSVIVVEPAAGHWTPGRYEVRVAGQGPFALRDLGGNALSGDFVVTFEVEGDEE